MLRTIIDHIELEEGMQVFSGPLMVRRPVFGKHRYFLPKNLAAGLYFVFVSNMFSKQMFVRGVKG